MQEPISPGRWIGTLVRKASFVVVSAALVCVLRLGLDRHYDGIPYVLFLASVAASTYYAGWRWGLGATLLGLLAGTYFFAEPRYRFVAHDPRDVSAALAFTAAASVIVAALAAEARAREKVQERDKRLREEEERRRKLEAQIDDARRLEAIGRLAGGVAHDFNNLLTVVQGSAALLRDRLPDEDLLDGIEIAARRGAALTKQLLGFARRQMLVVEPITLNEVVDEGVKLLSRLLPEDIQLVTELESTPWQLAGDKTQVQQVVLNLVTNARDALPKGGNVSIRTENVTLDERFAERHPEVSPGEYVKLSVTDNGIGMTDELQRRVFEPFFTTKAAGEGTGLGLAVTYGVVKQMNGHISVTSRVPGGSTFDVYWPRAAQRGPLAVEMPKRSTPDERRLVVLLVDDDDLVRSVTRQVLASLGHTVIEAENGALAIELARKHAGVIDVLLTDVVMPWMNGRELSEHLRKSRPELAVLFMSGYSENVILSRGVVKPGMDLITKPFAAEELELALRNVTRSRAAAS
jgi:two-component system cell cycle sensor histidine kinase/response regulator CckA